uniref:Uncharacterized protein ycf68 n=1 Tax=Keteleeria davidiana TaxID=3324 RepID=A0A8F4XMT3_KETDA|nr:hypothetical protein RF68 [Keteleeria davidiana]UWI54157.1 hypothetical protein [Keteleeria evelyniana var. pendula]
MAYSSCLFEPGFGTELILRRIDGAIQVRSNADPTLFLLFICGSGRSGGTGGYPRILSSRESIHPLSVYGWLFLGHRLKFSLDVENRAPNNASSQTKNYEITLFILGRVTEGSYHSSLFMLFLEVRRKQQSIGFPHYSLKE